MIAQKKKPTLADIARSAGVSVMTAGRALNSSPTSVAPATQQRIETVAKSLGYIPNLAASALSTQRSGLVGVLVSTLASPTFTVTLNVIRSQLQARNYQLLVGDTDYSSTREDAILRALLGRQVDGLILASAVHTSGAKALLKQSRIPVVEIWDLPRRPVRTAVGFDNRHGGALVAEHFVKAGYRRPVFVCGGERGANVIGEERSRKRWEGFRDRFRQLTGESPRILMNPDIMEFRGGAAAIGDILYAREPCDAAFFVYDVCAAGAVFECLRIGVDVPGEIAICGFGGFPIAEAMYPGLSTVRIPLEEIGHCAAAMMLTLLAGDFPKLPAIDVGCEVIRRQTS